MRPKATSGMRSHILQIDVSIVKMDVVLMRFRTIHEMNIVSLGQRQPSHLTLLRVVPLQDRHVIHLSLPPEVHPHSLDMDVIAGIARLATPAASSFPVHVIDSAIYCLLEIKGRRLCTSLRGQQFH